MLSCVSHTALEWFFASVPRDARLYVPSTDPSCPTRIVLLPDYSLDHAATPSLHRTLLRPEADSSVSCSLHSKLALWAWAWVFPASPPSHGSRLRSGEMHAYRMASLPSLSVALRQRASIIKSNWIMIPCCCKGNWAHVVAMVGLGEGQGSRSCFQISSPIICGWAVICSS